MSRYERQSSLIPTERMMTMRCRVVGVGAVGRQVALQLASMGVRDIMLYDHDIVEVVNLGPQMFPEGHVGASKVSSTRAWVQLLNTQVRCTAVERRFIPADKTSLTARANEVIFCCVDSIEARRMVWEATKDRAVAFFDSRCAAETVRILAVDKPWENSYYEQTLFSEAEAFNGQCTARMTIYIAAMAASMLTCQFARWLRNMECDRDMIFNMASGELFEGQAETPAAVDGEVPGAPVDGVAESSQPGEEVTDEQEIVVEMPF